MHDWTLFEQRHGGSPAVLIQCAHEAYRTFGQASRVNFHMEPYGNRRYVIDYACHAGAVAVEKSRT